MLLPTYDQLMSMLEDYEFGLDNPGWCTSCGEELEGLDPDAEQVKCDVCGARTGYGAHELLMQDLYLKE